MQFACDKTGFPVVTIEGLTLSLLPVTKLQFERFLCEPGGLSSSWYRQLLIMNPRASCRVFADKERESLFMTGITPEEAATFLSWLDPSARLPQETEWKRFARLLQQVPFTRETEESLFRSGIKSSVGELLKRLIVLLKPSNLAELALIRNGVMEWVTTRSKPGGLGGPRPSFFRNTFDPYNDIPLRHFADERSPYYGFRVLMDQEGR